MLLLFQPSPTGAHALKPKIFSSPGLKVSVRTKRRQRCNNARFIFSPNECVCERCGKRLKRVQQFVGYIDRRMDGLAKVHARLLEALFVLLCLVASHDCVLHILGGVGFDQFLHHLDSLVEARKLAGDLDDPLLVGDVL